MIVAEVIPKLRHLISACHCSESDTNSHDDKADAKYRVYVKSGSGWTRLTETAGSSYVHDKLTAGETYTYTLRGVDDKGDFVTDFNRDGWENTFIAPPVITCAPSCLPIST